MRREAEGGDQLNQAEEQKKEDTTVKVEKPEPATDRIGVLPPTFENIDNDFKPVILEAW